MHCAPLVQRLCAIGNTCIPKCLAAAFLLSPNVSNAAQVDPDWTSARQKAINRPRPLIFNNDGNEPVYFCKEASAEELLRSRTTPLAGSKVSTIFYCTWSSGFGLFTHHTKVGTLFDTREAMFKENRTREFFDKGIDPLRVMVEFGRKHGIEVFWSMRMNDTHDGSRADYGPVMFRANPLKNEHPEWLIGSKEKPPKYGAWSAVDYGVPEIRELAFRYCEEVARNYDVGGIELDFFRHAFFFKCSGKNASCGPKELEQMTGLVRRVRAATEAAGRAKGKPILLAIRVPDSVEYCRFIGLDLEDWLREGLVDILVVSGYTQLNPWEHSVRLAHKYEVKVYPSLDEPRLRDKESNALRQSLAAYRGRALAALSSGADGIYLFNYFDPNSALWRELHDAAVLRRTDRYYFPSVRGVGSMPVPHQRFLRVPTLNPASPVVVNPGTVVNVSFETGEAVSSANSGNSSLLLRAEPLSALKHSRVSLNGVALKGPREAVAWLVFGLPTGTLRRGTNSVEISVPDSSKPVRLLDCYASCEKRGG